MDEAIDFNKINHGDILDKSDNQFKLNWFDDYDLELDWDFMDDRVKNNKNNYDLVIASDVIQFQEAAWKLA